MDALDTPSGVYVAVYSGIQVYEMICRGIAVMKRHSDSWLNATQILKVAGVDKGRRTKILEREVLTGEHEKIQGGYGKYQGTWVPYARGVELCRQYMVHDYMSSILEYDPTASGTQEDQTPTKAELKKQMKSTQKSLLRAGIAQLKRERSGYEQATSAKRLKGVVSSTATSPLHSEGMSVHLPSGLGQGVPGTPAFPRGDSAAAVPRGLLHPAPFRQSLFDSSPAVYGADSAGPLGIRAWEDPPPLAMMEPGAVAAAARAKHDRMLLMNIFLNDDADYIPEWLEQADEAAPPSPMHFSDLPLSAGLSASAAEKPSKVDVDLVIDDQGHTAVHWAAALARIHVLDLLLYQGADARRLNHEGESALVRAVQVTNNYETQTFPDLLELLHDTIPLTDRQNRTVLHHIALATGIAGRERAARYYADCLLSWIVRLAGGYQVETLDYEADGAFGDEPHAVSNGVEKALAVPDLGRDLPTPTQSSSPNTRREQAAVSAFNADGAGAAEAMAETESSQQLGSGSGSGTLGADSARNADFAAFLNLQDSRGDTALNVAARFGDRAVIRMLLNAGASATICNSVGICPLDFGVDKIVELDADSGAFLPSDSAPFDEGSPRFNPATPRTLRRGMSAARDFVPLGSPTPAARRQSRLPADSALLDAGADGAILQTPRRAAALGAKRGLLSSPPPGSGRPWGGSRGLLDSGATPSGPSEVWSPVSAELRMHQSVQNIQRIMSDLEADFSGEMRVKQVHFDGIKQQLRNTTIELAKARETIHELHAKTAQLGEIKSRLGYLEETLARETSAVRAAISELPFDSKPRLDLEGLLESLLTSPAADDGSVRDDAETLSYLPPVPGVDLGALASGGSDVDELAASDPEKLSALVEQMRIVNQIYARRDALLRERVAALRKRADVSERERQYRQIIASCCEISEADVDIWIDRLVSAVESTDAAEDDEPSPATNGHAVNGTAHHTDANGLATS